MDCASCNGGGCDFCEGKGNMKIIGCPNDECRDMIGTIQMIDLYEKGLPPIQAGVLDQSAWFINAVSTWNREKTLAGK